MLVLFWPRGGDTFGWGEQNMKAYWSRASFHPAAKIIVPGVGVALGGERGLGRLAGEQARLRAVNCGKDPRRFRLLQRLGIQLPQRGWLVIEVSPVIVPPIDAFGDGELAVGLDMMDQKAASHQQVLAQLALPCRRVETFHARRYELDTRACITFSAVAAPCRNMEL